MSNIFYVNKCGKTGIATRTLLSLKGKVSITLSEETVYSWLLKRKVFNENYYHEFDKDVKSGKLVLASKENIEKYGVVLNDDTDFDVMRGFFIDTTKTNEESGRLVRRKVFFPQLCTTVSEEDYNKIKSLSGRCFGVQRINVHLGRTEVEVAVFVEGTVPDNGLYTLS